jgi:hypothetical protein
LKNLEVQRMTETPSPVVVPYAQFLEARDKRRRVAAELSQHDAERTIEGEAVAAPVEEPVPTDQPDPSASPRRTQNAERAT